MRNWMILIGASNPEHLARGPPWLHRPKPAIHEGHRNLPHQPKDAIREEHDEIQDTHCSPPMEIHLNKKR